MSVKTPTEKRLFGAVPLLPGLPSEGPTIETDSLEGFPTGTGHEDRASITSTSSSGDVIAQAPSPAPKPEVRWCLRHRDFMPNLLKEKTLGDDEYERYPVLLKKANHWLSENRWAHVTSCETVTWMSCERQLFTDNGVMAKSMSTDKKTRVTRGIRVWYFVADDTFYNKDALPPPVTLGFINCLPDPKNSTTTNMVNKINNEILKKPFPGKILKLETLHMNAEASDPDQCFWREQPEKDREYKTYMRLFYIEKMDDLTKYGNIAVCDFTPQCDQRSIHSSGYEVYSDVWKRASRWIHKNPKLRVLNFQSFYVKFKKEGHDSQVHEKCNFKEHGSAHGSLNNQKTEYLTILRVVYFQPSPGRDIPSGEGMPKKMYYSNFSPTKLKKPGASSEDKEELGENSYEDMRMAEDKLNIWLARTGARYFGVETVCSRLRSGGQDALGPEATFSYNSKDKSHNRELWRNTIRLHIESDAGKGRSSSENGSVSRMSLPGN